MAGFPFSKTTRRLKCRKFVGANITPPGRYPIGTPIPHTRSCRIVPAGTLHNILTPRRRRPEPSQGAAHARECIFAYPHLFPGESFRFPFVFSCCGIRITSAVFYAGYAVFLRCLCRFLSSYFAKYLFSAIQTVSPSVCCVRLFG